MVFLSKCFSFFTFFILLKTKNTKRENTPVQGAWRQTVLQLLLLQCLLGAARSTFFSFTLFLELTLELLHINGVKVYWIVSPVMFFVVWECRLHRGAYCISIPTSLFPYCAVHVRCRFLTGSHWPMCPQWTTSTGSMCFHHVSNGTIVLTDLGTHYFRTLVYRVPQISVVVVFAVFSCCVAVTADHTVLLEVFTC